MAEEAFQEYIPDFKTRQFVLKNLERRPDGSYGWKLNYEAIYKAYEEITSGLNSDIKFDKPTLFVRGGMSDYITNDDFKLIREIFPNAELLTIPGAGHWIHAETPKEFLDAALEFFERKS